MFRFPIVDFVFCDDETKQYLYSQAYDIFISFKDLETEKVFQQQNMAQVPGVSVDITLINHPSDLLKYKTEKTKEEVQQEIINSFNYTTVFEYAGFEIVQTNNPIFTNIFMQTQTLKQEVINLIKSARFITNQQDYIDTVISIPDTSVELLEQFKRNIKQQIDKDNFDMIVENLLQIMGGFLDMYFNGRYQIKNGITLPPLQGIQNDILDLYKSQYMKDKLLTSVNGNKIIKATTDPFVQCMIKMMLRVYNNYAQLNREKKREELLLKQNQMQAQQTQQDQ